MKRSLQLCITKFLFTFCRESMAEESVEVVVGSYEEFLLGFKLVENEDGTYKFEKSFSDHAHKRSVRCIASNKKFLASGSLDESIHLFFMKTRTEFGTLQHHNGTVTGLEFYGNFLFSCSEDGTICIWSTKNWHLEKTLLGHKNGVIDIAVHSSGKLALSVSSDKSLRTWNLIKGRSAYITNIKKVANIVEWAPSSEHFVTVCGNQLEVYSLEIGGVIHEVTSNKRINAVTFVNDSICAFGDEGGQITLHNIIDKIDVQNITAHSNRIKGLKSIANQENVTWLFSISSDGFLKLWQINLALLEKEPVLLCEVNMKCRPTCLTVLPKTNSN